MSIFFLNNFSLSLWVALDPLAGRVFENSDLVHPLSRLRGIRVVLITGSLACH